MFRRRQRSAHRARSAYRSPFLYGRKPLIELLEDRRMLAVVSVSNVLDNINGDTSSIAALIADDGGDGISLREAMTAANNTANSPAGTPDQIHFDDLPAGFQTINIGSALPIITDPVVIDGYVGRAGATPNTNGVDMGLNTSLEIIVSGGGGAYDGFGITSGGDGSTIRGLVVQNFGFEAIQIEDSNNNKIEGNFLGTNVAGNAAVGNNIGVFIIGNSQSNVVGGTTAAARNLISANSTAGILMLGGDVSLNVVQGNLIGTRADGANDLGNKGDGVEFVADAHNNTVGGLDPGTRNVISGNDINGIYIANSGTFANNIFGNYIGVAVDGITALGNTQNGVHIIAGANNTVVGGSNPAARNIISGNLVHGLYIANDDTDFNIVWGNYIGTAADGVSDLGNAMDGVRIEDGASNNSVGGPFVGAGNIIAFNEDGVDVRDTSTDGNRVQRNSMFNNSDLGIDLIGGGPTPNDPDDPDDGPNQIQNFPVFIGSATLQGNSVALTYNIDSTTGNSTYPLTVDFYIADAANQEGQTYFASDMYIAGEAEMDKFVVLPLTVPLTNLAIVATATDDEGNTSEFSNYIEIQTPIILGSKETIVREDELSDYEEQYFQYTAHDTGKLFIRTHFLHVQIDIDIEVYDQFGNLIASSMSSSPTQNFEEVINPVVTQENYFIRVFTPDMDDDSRYPYTLEIENFPAPVPSGVHLDPLSDTGMMNNDGVTMDKTPTFFIQTDVFNFVDTNNDGIYIDPDFVGPPAPPAVGHDSIDVLTAAEAQAILDGMPMAGDESGGIAVQVTLVNTTSNELFTFFADPVIASVPDVYRLDIPDNLPLTAGTYLVAARTFIFDGQGDAEGEPDQAMGRSNASPPLWFTIDCEAPFDGTIDLLSHSDSGMYDNDRVTNKMSPAFYGIGEANAKVRVYAQRTDDMGMPIGTSLLVGSGVVGSDLTDGEPDGYGQWEVTVEPLIDGKYNFYAVFEDAAGNISDPVGLSPDPVLKTDVNMAIPNGGAPVDSTVTVTPANFPGLVGNAPNMVIPIIDVNVTINITHTMDEDLDVILIAPDGTMIDLTSDNGDGGNNYTDTIFDDSASTKIEDGTAPFTGRFRPEQPLSTLNGLSPFGDWTLRVTDDMGNDFTGEFLNWTLEIDVPLMVVIDTFAPNTPFLDLQSGPTVRSIQFVNDPTLGTITDVDVTISIDHPHVADLTVYLVSPEGTRVLLTANNGGDGANYTDTEFDDEAAVSITTVVTADAPFTGTFRPQGLLALADFDGEDPFGVWTLEVTDDFQPFEGQLLNWTLDIMATAGNFSTTSNDVLAISSDTGRHDHDNVTKDNMPTVTMTSSDLNTFAHLLWTDNFKFRIYDRYQNTAEFLLYDSALDMDVFDIEDPDDVFTALTFITEMLPNQYFDIFGTNNAVLDVSGEGVLADGVHNLKLEVEDRAGNISPDFILEITIDTQYPPVSFGLPAAANEVDGLAADSDSGVTTQPETYSDRITNDTTPRLWGRAEADTIVRVFLDNPLAGTLGVVDLDNDFFLGQTVAVPYDGNDAYPDGYWEIVSALDLNEIYNSLGLPKDGLRRLLVTAEDLAGNPMPMNDEIRDGVDQLDIFIDTQGPQVNDVYITDYNDYDLFDPKPSEYGYTPLVFSLTIEFLDQPNRLSPDFLYEAVKEDIATNPGNYLLVGDHVGVIAIDEVFVDFTIINNGNPAYTGIQLDFFAPLPDDRYTLTILDNIVDPPGNHLDGESNADEPQEYPQFPSGDGVPGGDFVARFTVDSRPEIGSYVSQTIHIDINGNFVWDPANDQIGNDATNVDITFTLPVQNGPDGPIGLGGFNVHDLLFAGKFRPFVEEDGEAQALLNGNPRYFDQLAAYGFSAELGVFRWLIDTNSDGVVTLGTDILTTQAPLANFDVASAIPVAGNFDGNLNNGDEIGLYNDGVWALDLNHDFVISAGEVVVSGNLFGQPIVGDFDGDGFDDLGVFNNNVLYFDLTQDGFYDQTIVLGFPGVLDKPVAADMDQDGIDDVGLWVPRSSANPSGGAAEWYFLISNDYFETERIFGTVNTLDHAFTPVPFGNDLFAVFGAERALPIVGNFDPPVAAAAPAAASAATSSSSESSASQQTSEPSAPAETLTETTDTAEQAVVETVDTTPTTSDESETAPAAILDDGPSAKVETAEEAESATAAPEPPAAEPVANTAAAAEMTTADAQSGSGSQSTSPFGRAVDAPVTSSAIPVSSGPVDIGAAISAYQHRTPAPAPAPKPAAPAKPAPTVVEVASEAVADPVVAPVKSDPPKTVPTPAPADTAAAPFGKAPAKSGSPAQAPPVVSGPVDLKAAISAYTNRPAANPVSVAPASAAATSSTAGSGASTQPTALAAATLVSVSAHVSAAPASLTSTVVAEPQVVQDLGTAVTVAATESHELAKTSGPTTASLDATLSDSQISRRSAASSPTLQSSVNTLDGDDALLEATVQQQDREGLVEEAIEGVDLSAVDEDVLEALGDGFSDDDAAGGDALAVAWQEWSAL